MSTSVADFFDRNNHYTSPPLTDEMVTAAERTLGYSLPASYVRLLRVKNGGVPRRQCFPTAGTYSGDNHVRMTVLFGVGGMWGIDSEQFGSQKAIREAGFPEIGIIVGMTPTAGHDGIFLDYSACGPRGEPRVTHVDSEDGNSQVLAPDFDTFLRGLVDCRPYEEQFQRELDEFRKRSR